MGIAQSDGTAPVLYGQIAAIPEAVTQLARQLRRQAQAVHFCYAAGPCGYALYRPLIQLGYDCTVVAPALIPRKPAERIKTDRRDALTLARWQRSGDLTAGWVPDVEQEALRDLVRCREDFKGLERHARQRLQAVVWRHGKIYGGKSRWTQAHWRWLEDLRMDHPLQQSVLEEYLSAGRQAQARVVSLEQERGRAIAEWSLAPVVYGLRALRGVALITAMTVVAELGDLTRFDSPRQLMAYLGLVPSEASRGTQRRRGGITKTGNGHVRRVLVEAAWCYRFPARQTTLLRQRAAATNPQVEAIAWKAQKRLCNRYRRLRGRGLPKAKVCIAVARELAGFVWAIAGQVMNSQGRTVSP